MADNDFDDWAWKQKKFVLSNEYGEIYGMPWYSDLREVIRSGGNITAFLEEKNRQLHQEFDMEVIAPQRQIAGDYLQKVKTITTNIEDTRKISVHIDEFNDDVAKILQAYPPEKQGEIKKVLQIYIKKGHISAEDVVLLKSRPKGLWNKIKSSSRFNAADKLLDDFISKYNEIDIPSLIDNLSKDSEFSNVGSYLQRKLESSTQFDSTMVDYYTREITDNLLLREKDTVRFKELYENKLVYIQRLEDSFDNATFPSRESQLIAEFVADKKEYILNPPKIDEVTLRSKGLTEEYIQGQIEQSKYPQKVRNSIRRFYEDLDRPASPMVAFGIESGQEDKILNRLKEIGLDVVSEVDPRAVNPDVFVVDKKNKVIYAPFLAPDEALKANTMMIEAVYDSGGVVALSNPRTRETMVIATDKSLNGLSTSKGGYELDLETVAKHYSTEHYDEIMSGFYGEYTSKDVYARLSSVMEEMKKDNPEKYAKLVDELRAGANPYLTSGQWTQENANLLGKKFFESHQEDFMPYVKKKYEDTMLAEAFEHGISPKVPNEANIRAVKNGEPLVSVFHGGQNGALPYSILARDKRMCFTYAASSVKPVSFEVNGHKQTYTNGCIDYAFGQSSHNQKYYGSKRKFGFIYEYESRGNKQEFMFLESRGVENGYYRGEGFDPEKLSGHGDETPVFPHQNKLKKMYIAVEGYDEQRYYVRRVFPLDLDENGKIKDERWRNFVELHNPVDDNFDGLMVSRHNSAIKQYDELGKEKMWRKLKIVPVEQEIKPHVVAKESQVAEVQKKAQTGAEKMNKAVDERVAAGTFKTVEKTAGHAVQEVPKRSGLIARVAEANARFDAKVDKVIEKGDKLLNENKVGRWYNKISNKVANSSVGKAISRATSKVGKVISRSASKVGKAVVSSSVGRVISKIGGKAAAKIGGKALGKSLLKKVPLVSIVAGSCFAVQRALKGEWGAAGGELLSGVLGTFPGVGTAASVAVDAGLAGYDIHKACQEDKLLATTDTPKKTPKNLSKQIAERMESKNKREIRQTVMSPEMVAMTSQNRRA